MNFIAIIVRRSLVLVIAVLVYVSVAVAQDDSGSSDSGAVPAATAPAEQNNAENPPLSGLDQPVAEPAFGGRSYLMPGVQLSESADSNAAGGSTKNSHTSEISRALVSADLQKIWRKYQFGLDYVAGGDFYAGPLITKGQGRATQEHSLAAVQRILWRTGQLAIRDSLLITFPRVPSDLTLSAALLLSVLRSGMGFPGQARVPDLAQAWAEVVSAAFRMVRLPISQESITAASLTSCRDYLPAAR